MTMNIKYLQKTSLIDYPDTIASIVFVGGCNLSCGYCYNKALWDSASQPDLPTTEILNQLQARKNYCDGIVITGGEPCLQPELAEFLTQLKKIGYKIKLDTNGTFPNIVQNLLDQNLINYIAMDIKAPFARYNEITGQSLNMATIQKSISIIQNAGISCEFRSTIWKEAFQKEQLIQMASQIKGTTPYYLQNFFNSQNEKQSGYTPFTQSEINSILPSLRELTPHITLRGDWH